MVVAFPSMAKKSAKGAGAAGALEIEVVLEETQPRIWRRIVVSSKATLSELHRILQVAMGWTDSHLHQFRKGDQRYADPSHEVDDTIPESHVALGELLRRKGDLLGYEYDFGDSWTHTIRLKAVLPAAEAGALPRCVGGERACPPEDCGGVFGYDNLLAILADPKHEEHEEHLEWLGGKFDPSAFDEKAATRALRRVGGGWVKE